MDHSSRHAETTAIFGETKIQTSSIAALFASTNSSLWASVSVLIQHPPDANMFQNQSFFTHIN